jgi:hypothetical protein
MPEKIEPPRAEAVTRDHLEKVVADGIRMAVSDPKLWEAAGIAMRAQAQSAAGGWVMGGVTAFLKKAAWIVFIVAGVYFIGGWGAVLAFFKTQGASH